MRTRPAEKNARKKWFPAHMAGFRHFRYEGSSKMEDHTLIRGELGKSDIVQSASDISDSNLYTRGRSAHTRTARFDDKQTLLCLLR